jgi:myo-inositol-1(or 4)-monophosphatase
VNYENECVRAIAMEAGEIALRHFRGIGTLYVEAKGPLDLVTAADREVEAFICRELTRCFPDDGIFGEEGSSVISRSGRTWVLDPIDGTFNFVRGSDGWGISIGLFENGRAVFGIVNTPARDEIFAGGDGVPASLNGAPLPPLRPFSRSLAALGIGIHPSVPDEQGLQAIGMVTSDLGFAYRVTGSTVISLIEIAKGFVDGYLGRGIPSWDIMGMLPALEQLGVRTDINWARVGLETELDFICARPEVIVAMDFQK